jgi:hypothetical protein
MKKIIITAITVCAFLNINNTATAQQIVSKKNEAAAPTPKNVLAWARELLPQLEKFVEKLKKMKPAVQRDIETKKTIERAGQIAKEILEAGDKLNAADARKHDIWFRTAIAKGIDDCLERNPGSECCFSCKGSGGFGYHNFWCQANCFVASFSWPD